MSSTILPTRNEIWGFYGTMTQIDADAQRAWAAASARIAAETSVSAEGVRDFLDSRHGRHFADDVASGLHAGHGIEDSIEKAIARWQGWRINRSTSRETGIPAGLPYLTGFATHFQILAEADA